MGQTRGQPDCGTQSMNIRWSGYSKKILILFTVLPICIARPVMDEVKDRLLSWQNIQDSKQNMRYYFDKDVGDTLSQLTDSEYEDFPEVPPLLRVPYLIPSDQQQNELGPKDIFKTPSKRYLGIEIPDYVASRS